MLFEKTEQLNLIGCPSCKGTGSRGFRRCRVCDGRAVGLWRRDRWLEWNYPLTRFNLNLLNGRRIWNKIRRISLIVAWLNCWIWAMFLLYRSGEIVNFVASPANWQLMVETAPSTVKILLLLGCVMLLVLWRRIIVEQTHSHEVEKFDYERAENSNEHENSAVSQWSEVKSISASRKLSINETFTDEAMASLAEAYRFADKTNSPYLSIMHIFYSLLSFNRISNVFIRLGVPAKMLQDNLKPVFSTPAKMQNANTMPIVAPESWQVVFQAYEVAYLEHQDYVSVTELLVACINQSPVLQELLYDLDIDKNKLLNVVEWARIRERLYRQYAKQVKKGSRRSKYGMDKAMTALATPYLNQFSEDMTRMAQLGQYEFCVARDKEMREIFRIVEGGSMSVVLTGSYGVGKRTIVEGLAERMISDDVPERLNDKRLVKLNIASLLSGTTAAGAIERLIGIMNDISRARNVILFIHNIHELVGVSAGEGSSLDVADTLADYLKSGRFLTIATTTNDEFAQHISDSALANVFTKVEVPEMDENQSIQVLESKIAHYEHKNQVFFSYDAVEKSVNFASRFLHETCLPGSALEIASEAASYTHGKKGANSLVSAEEVAKVVADKTGIPTTSVSTDESGKLMHLEEEMHRRVIGQDEAVDLVANALRRARVEIRSKSRPIANFLCLGPTGVGKTELAKTIASVYFGGEDRMIRLDMSEYQDKTGVYRLIGAPGEKGTGILTEAIRRHPFALVLLDEIEKADPDILNLFLQVMDDGRLTDSTGRVVDFTNVILIATSNAGTGFVQDQLRAGLSSEAIKERLLHGELKQYFRPEFLNRFDGIVLFKSLDLSDIKKIAEIMLKRVVGDLEQKGIEFSYDDAALDFLAKVGFDPDFGARPMRRALQERVENKLAEMILTGAVKRRDKIHIGAEGKIEIEL